MVDEGRRRMSHARFWGQLHSSLMNAADQSRSGSHTCRHRCPIVLVLKNGSRQGEKKESNCEPNTSSDFSASRCLEIEGFGMIYEELKSKGQFFFLIEELELTFTNIGVVICEVSLTTLKSPASKNFLPNTEKRARTRDGDFSSCLFCQSAVNVSY
jgi:hypothetical protein